MPELPEIETLCRQMSRILQGATIVDAEVLDSKIGNLAVLRGRTVEFVRREGKAVVLEMGNQLRLRIHLRMSGRLFWRMRPEGWPSYTRFCIHFRTGDLLCLDPRRFATAEIRRTETRGNVVPDALLMKDTKKLQQAAKGRRLPVKLFLMDQETIAGIGNIYACEILHRAAVDPRRPAGCISLPQWQLIVESMDQTLKLALRCRGTSISDWRDLYGRKGRFQNYLKVYDRRGKFCFRCGDTVQRIVLGGRGTYFCPSCQH